MSSRWLVFGRTEYAEPLTERGGHDGPHDAFEAPPGEWVELVLVPEDAVHWLVRDGEEAGAVR